MNSDHLRGKKILLVGGYPPPWGGISVHIQALRNKLKQWGAKVEVLDLGSKKGSQSGINPVRTADELAWQLARYASRRFVTHAHISGHNSKSWMIALGGALARDPFAPSPILTLHSGLVPHYIEMKNSHRNFARWVGNRYGRVVVVNSILKDKMEETGIATQKLVVLPALVDIPNPKTPPQQWTALRESYNPLVVSIVGNSPVYGTRILLEGFGRLVCKFPNAGLVIIGKIDNLFAIMARQLLLENKVRLLGEVERLSVLGAIAQADLFVRPSLVDGDALSVREALALGCRVVASAVGYRPPGTCLFKNADPFDLALKMEQALSQPVIQNPAIQKEEPTWEAFLSLYRTELPSSLSPSQNLTVATS